MNLKTEPTFTATSSHCNAPRSIPKNMGATESPEKIRARLEAIFSDKTLFFKSAKTSFRQFDTDKSGTLTYYEIKSLIQTLCENLQLPPVDDVSLKLTFDRYDIGKKKQLSVNEFCEMYWLILLRIRDLYYPTKKMRIRRSVFVSRVQLKEEQIEDRFEKIKPLSSGAFGEVHLVRDKIGDICRVMKVINKAQSKVPLEQIEAEVEVLKSLDHPYIIKIFEVQEDYNSIYIIMEECKGGELIDRLNKSELLGGRFSEKYVSQLLKQILQALSYFHERKIVHKDIKPENILFKDKSEDSNIKIIDFGLAELFERIDSHSNAAAGTALYMAPEVFKRDFTLKCDVWSAGVLAYFLLVGKLPFVGNTLEKVKKQVLYSKPCFNNCEHLSNSAVQLLKKMLDKDYSTRPSATELLQDPWFVQASNTHLAISSLLLENLRQYTKQSQLKISLINLLVHHLNISGTMCKEISDTFSQLDTDGNGTLSHDELIAGLQKHDFKIWDINRILQALDVDDSGNVSYSEFIAACFSWRESELNIIWSAFKKLDTDGDGKLTVSDFMSMLNHDKNKFLPYSEAAEMVKQVDKNNDGMIDWDEFLEYIQS